MFDDGGFGSLPQFGSMGSGFGQGMFAPPQQQKKKKNDFFNPLMMLSPMGGMLMSHPSAALFGISPALGVANLLGAFK